jgi:hypothetical protein
LTGKLPVMAIDFADPAAPSIYRGFTGSASRFANGGESLLGDGVEPR